MRNLLLLAGATTALRTSTLGLGCFWEPSEKLLALDGVVDTRCGYAGATFPDASWAKVYSAQKAAQIEQN